MKDPRGKRYKKIEEKKVSKTISILPSTYKNLTKISSLQKKSTSEIIEALIKRYIDDNAALLDVYDELNKKEE